MPRPARERRMITYPTNHLLGVLDDPASAGATIAALVALGMPPGDVRVLAGSAGLAELSRLGPRPNLLSRLVRVVQFMSMDQTPDFLAYEAALRDGRAVLAIRVADRKRVLAVRDRLDAAGVHFLNHYGRFWTEEISLWRGPEPDIPGVLRR